MMTGNSRKGYQGKQEEDNSNTAHQHQQQHHHMISSSIERLYSKVGSSSSSSSRQWSGLRNPRIVRVSRSFGGKDRHSKVCTIRGLRDRRIRLSVPTAIQLYELQDRLGLNQPSKVIDWLIEATKQDIDKLPPLPIPFGFPQFLHPQQQQQQQHNQTLIPPPDHHHQSSSSSHHHQFSAFFDANNNGTASFMDSVSRLKGKELDERGKWVMKTNNEEYEIGGGNSAQILFPSGNNANSSSSSSHSCLPMTTYYNNPFQSEPSNFLSLFGSHAAFPNNNNNHQVDSGHHTSLQFPSSSSSSAVSQLLFCPSTTSAAAAAAAAATPSLFGPYYAPYSSVSLETADPRMQQLNHFQLMSSSNNSHLLHHPLLLPSLKPLIPTPPFSSRLLDSNDKDATHHQS